MVSGANVLGRIDSLTGLRFLAALAVYLHHHPKPSYLPDWVRLIMTAGYNGVTIFFVLSGFVIGLNYFQSLVKPTTSGLVKYAVARLARVYPMYALVLLYVWLAQGIPPDTQDVFFHFIAVQAWSPEMGFAYSYNSVGWSVGVEFFFYACFPLLVLILAPFRNNKKALWILAIAITLVLLGVALYFQLEKSSIPLGRPASAHRWLYRTPSSRLGDFALGVIGALLFQSLMASGYSKRLWRFVPYLASAGILLLMAMPQHLNTAFSWDASYAPLAFLLVLGLALAPQTRFSRLLATRPFIILGEASYVMYLIHVQLVQTIDIEQYLDFEPWVATCLWIATAGIWIALSISLHTYVETPARKWINRWGNQMTRALEKPEQTFDTRT